MKLTFVFLVVSGIIIHLKFSEAKQNDLMPQAIYQVIKKHYVKNSVKFEIFYNSNDLDVLEKTLKSIKELKDYRITKVDDQDKNEFDLKQSGILIFDTLENFKKLWARVILSNKGPEGINILVYCQDLTLKRLGEIEVLPGASYLIEENGAIVLKTWTFFTPVKCRESQLIDVNKFSRKSMKWTGSTFFLTMIRDFHGCHLYFNVHNIVNAELFYALERHLNFKFDQVTRQLKTSQIDHNLTNLVQFEYSTYFYVCDLSVPLYSAPYVVAVPPGALYTPIETFFLPFDLETWILFSLVFILAFSMVVVVKLSRSRSLKVLIVGENVPSPGLNIFGIFMGVGMMTLPRRSFSRILLMNFILFSMIMRTAYQGKYFEFMTKETHKRAIQSVAELIEKNYTLHVFASKLKHERNKDTYKDDLGRLKFVAVSRFKSALESKLIKELQDPSFKGCLLDFLFNFELYEKMYSSLKFNLLQEEFDSRNFGICFRKQGFMSPIFRLKIEQLVTGGVFEKMESWKKHVHKITSKKPPPEPYNTVLTLKHLSIGFYIWLLMILLSILAFTGDMLKYWGPKVARMLFFEYILSKFYKMQRSMH